MKRIVQLKNGEIPTGYKKTELGVLPSDWTIVSLGELLVFQNGVNVAKEKYDSGVKMISVMDILGDSPIYYDCIRGQVDIDGDTLKKYEVTYGDLLFLRSSETVEDAGIANVYLDRRGATFSGFVIRGKKNAQYEPYYLNKSLQNQQTRKQIIRNAAGTQHFNIGQASLNRVLVPFAPSSEQAKIAEILMTWDKAIELHKQQIEKLKQFKSVCLKKMFPAKGQTVPEWRFKGFTGEWEQRKIGECFSERNERKTNGELISVTIESGVKRFSEIGRSDNSNEDKSQYKRVMIGDIAYNTMRMWQGASGCSPYNGIVSPAYTVISPFKDIDPLFFAYMFKRKDLIYTFQVHSQGMTSDNWLLKFPQLSEIDVMLPCGLAEQNAISTFLNNLDNEISLNQRELGAKQKQRKALMHLLLTGIVRVKK